MRRKHKNLFYNYRLFQVKYNPHTVNTGRTQTNPINEIAKFADLFDGGINIGIVRINNQPARFGEKKYLIIKLRIGIKNHADISDPLADAH